jgi:nucleoside-diphosphate kinase
MTIITPCIFIIKPSFLKREVLDAFYEIFLDSCEYYKVKRMRLSKELAEQHYIQHKDKPHFDDLIGYMTSDEVLIFMVPVESVENARQKTLEFRAKFATSMQYNVLHCSDSISAAKREFDLFFGGDNV